MLIWNEDLFQCCHRSLFSWCKMLRLDCWWGQTTDCQHITLGVKLTAHMLLGQAQDSMHELTGCLITWVQGTLRTA